MFSVFSANAVEFVCSFRKELPITAAALTPDENAARRRDTACALFNNTLKINNRQ